MLRPVDRAWPTLKWTKQHVFSKFTGHLCGLPGPELLQVPLRHQLPATSTARSGPPKSDDKIDQEIFQLISRKEYYLLDAVGWSGILKAKQSKKPKNTKNAFFAYIELLRFLDIKNAMKF